MKLGFDIDGIIADLPQSMVEHINKEFNLNYTQSIFVNYNIFKNKYVDDAEKNDEIALSILKNIVQNSDALLAVRVYKDGTGALRKLVKAGHSIHFITARPASKYKVTVDWVRDNKIPFNTIHTVGRDSNFESKGKLGRSLNLDFFIDDFPHNLEEMYKYKERWRKGVALFNRPWNINTPLDGTKFNRFDSWEEIIRHLGVNKR